MMRRIFLIFSTVALLVSLFALVSFADTDIDQHRSCSQCGMDRKAYGYSRMLVLYQDGGQSGVCSLHCAVIEIDTHKEHTVKSILVADRDTRLMIDAEKAIWVIGGKKRGVMTQLPKWAFGTEATARSFIAANGGSIASWAEAQAAAREEIVHK
jgi:nitrous oxide reductase accessory protein NosL